MDAFIIDNMIEKKKKKIDADFEIVFNHKKGNGCKKKLKRGEGKWAS